MLYYVNILKMLLNAVHQHQTGVCHAAFNCTRTPFQVGTKTTNEQHILQPY